MYKNPFLDLRYGQNDGFYNPTRGFKGFHRFKPQPEVTPDPIHPTYNQNNNSSGDDNPDDSLGDDVYYDNFSEMKAWMDSGWQNGYYGTVQDAIEAAKKGNSKAKAALEDFVGKGYQGKPEMPGIIGSLLSKLGIENNSNMGTNWIDAYNAVNNTNYSQPGFVEAHNTGYTHGTQLGDSAGAVGSGTAEGGIALNESPVVDNSEHDSGQAQGLESYTDSSYDSSNDSTYSDTGYSDSIDTGGFNLGGKIRKIYNEGYTAPGQAYAIAKSKGYNIGGMIPNGYHRMPDGSIMANSAMTYNSGGKVGEAPARGSHKPVYANNGMLMNHPYEREGQQFDTIPAMLTEGEFVVDADSTHKFKDQLEKINAWEPGSDEDKSMDQESSMDEMKVVKELDTLIRLHKGGSI